MVKQYEIYMLNLDPTIGSEMNKVRPCVVLSPNEMNKFLNNIIIAPMTSTVKGYPTRVGVNFGGKNGEIVLDQIKTVDKKRIIKLLGNIEKKDIKEIKRVIKEMLVD
jgi:mRNA interferase MazF